MKVYLLAAMTIRESGLRSFLADRQLDWREDHLGTVAQRLIEFAGRICYLSFGRRQSSKSNADYVRHLIAQGHESVLEHSVFSLVVDGASRSFTHQLVRHRVGFSYSQLSQQYHDESDTEFVEPQGLRQYPTAYAQWKSAVDKGRQAYSELMRELERSDFAATLPSKERSRAIRSAARSVLPGATAAAIVVTGNARAWRQLLRVRGATPGDLEMREFCVKSLEVLKPEAPDVFAQYRLSDDRLGTLVLVE